MKSNSEKTRKKDIIARSLEITMSRAQEKVFIDPGSSFKGYKSITYQQLYKASGRGAAYLKSRGIRRGDNVVILVTPGISFYVAVFSLLRAGGTAVFIPLSMFCSRKKIFRKTVKIKAVITYPVFFPLLALHGFDFLISIHRLKDTRLPGDCPPENRHSADPAMITFTTGTTGTPKAIIRTYGYLGSLNQAMDEVFKPRPGAVDYCTFPQFVFNNALSGMRTIIGRSSSPRHPGRFLKLIKRAGLNRITASPGFIVALAEYCCKKDIILPGIREIYTGGAPVHPEKLSLVCRMAPNSRTTFVYGSSEAQPISSVSYREMDREVISQVCNGWGIYAGTPVSMIRVEIIPIGTRAGENTAFHFLPVNQVGEIIVSGDNVNKGEKTKGDESKLAINGIIWHRTGDAGFLDEKGGLWVAGRLAHGKKIKAGYTLINNRNSTKSKYLFPCQVELRVESLPEINRCGCLFPEKEDKAFLFLERKCPLSKTRKEEIAGMIGAILAGYGLVPVIRYCRKIPVDHRHYYRVDYRKLRGKISGRE